MLPSEYFGVFDASGGSTFITTKPIKAFVTDGKLKSTNSYYGSSAIFRPTYSQTQIPINTVLIACPGGKWFVINNTLAAFDLSDTNPNSVGVFEKHYYSTNDILWRYYKQGIVVEKHKGTPANMKEMYAKLLDNQK